MLEAIRLRGEWMETEQNYLNMALLNARYDILTTTTSSSSSAELSSSRYDNFHHDCDMRHMRKGGGGGERRRRRRTDHTCRVYSETGWPWRTRRQPW